MGLMTGISAEVKSAAVFALAALVLSLITGIAAGNNLANALVTSVILTLVFAAIGYGAVVVLRRFVPELIEALGNASRGAGEFEDVSVAQEAGAAAERAVDAGQELPERKSDEKLEKEFTPFGKGDFKNLGSTTGDGKLGTHFVKEQKTVKYEPKIIAEAIRTMIRRDDKD
ncbi:MAG: hypothetical protein KBA61_09040 [Spirochaetes bacterium]|nr:hypothetical protein [Spirochaetota bacterium]